MATNVLDPSALCSLLPTLLPQDSKKLNSSHDGIAALAHTALAAVAFRLIAIDESSTTISSTGNVLPAEWNKHGPGNYTFRYRHDQSSLEFVVKIIKLGARTLINAIAVESDKAASMDISTNDFVSPSFFPHDLTSADAQPLVHGFIASNRIADLVSRLKLQIIQRLIPGLRKDGYTEEADSAPSTSSGSNLSRSDPQPARPAPGMPPHAPDYYSHIPPENPLSIGRRDLDPFPGINPSNPFSPPPLFPSGGDGMFVGPDHPIFGGRQPGGFGRGSPGPWGGDGFLPPMGAPPGARFDPVGPLGGVPGGFGGRGRGRGGRGPLGGPDNDEFMPPGMGDMFM
ncbi:hypothetical protein HWV62_19935 [Athelia sp. TMB]|nr:hypothetical protein HWV62_19935 [Athelia sp. TMB]